MVASIISGVIITSILYFCSLFVNYRSISFVNSKNKLLSILLYGSCLLYPLFLSCQLFYIYYKNIDSPSIKYSYFTFTSMICISIFFIAFQLHNLYRYIFIRLNKSSVLNPKDLNDHS
jgi:heme/copper-type cytochrome/quinol oxidase subunit 3